MKASRTLMVGAVLMITLLLMLSGARKASAERFFQQNSTWYEPIPATPLLDSDSANKVEDILCVKDATANYPAFGPDCSGQKWFYPSQIQPIARATASTPWTKFMTWECAKNAAHPSCTTDYKTFQKLGWDDAPIPAGALPADNQTHLNCFPGTCGDGWLAVTNSQYEWDCGGGIYFPTDWPEARLRGKYACRYLRRWDSTDDGVLWPTDNNGSPRFAWTPFLHGVITYNEVVNEPEINHALSFGYSGAQCEPHWLLYPSPAYSSGTVVTMAGSSCDKNNPSFPLRNPARTGTKPLLGGERVFLPSSVNCDAIGITNMLELKICKALKKYGMIFVENSGQGYNGIHVEDTTGKPYSWGSLYQGFMKKIPWSKLQVSQPIYPRSAQTTSPPAPSDSQSPTNPTNLKATVMSSSQINLTWTTSTDNVGVSGYKVYVNGSLSATTTKPSLSDTGLSPLSTYEYRVSAYDASGNTSVLSTAVKATTLSAGSTAPATVIIDNGGAGTSYTGAWSVSGAASPYGANSLYGRSGATYRWKTTLPKTGTYAVYAWWTAYPSRSTSVPLTVTHSGGSKTVYVNQQVNGGKWNYLGTFTFDVTKGGEVKLSAPASAPTSYSADAMKFVQVP